MIDRLPEQTLQTLKQLDMQLESIKKDFDLVNMQKRCFILELFIEHELPKNAEIKPDGRIVLPEPILESNLEYHASSDKEYHNEGAV